MAEFSLGFRRPGEPQGMRAGEVGQCARRDEPLWRVADDDLADRVESELAATGLFAPGDVVSRFVIRKD